VLFKRNESGLSVHVYRLIYTYGARKFKETGHSSGDLKGTQLSIPWRQRRICQFFTLQTSHPLEARSQRVCTFLLLTRRSPNL